MKVCVLILLFVLGFGLNSNSTSAQEPATYFPTDNWLTSTPEQQGMDSAALANAVRFLAERDDYRAHSLLVLRHGYIVTDAYFYPYESGEPHDLASVTKSVISTLVGVAIQQGFLQSVEQPIGEIITVPEDKADLTIENLLTMRSGVECVDSPFELTLVQMTQTPDWSQFVLDLPMTSEPGTEWVYCSPAVHLLAALVQTAVGQSAYDFAMQNLFEPLGIQNAGWPHDPQGVVHGWGDLRLAPHDMAKIGYLYLNDGMWDGQQLLPQNWVTDATRNIRTGSEPGYGYLWWLPDPSYYAAQGRGGQFILVVPDEELIIVMTGGGGDGRPDMLLNEFILPAIQSDEPLAANTAGETELRNAIEAVARSPEFEPQPVKPIPTLVQDVSGRTVQLDPNPFGLLTLSLTFNSADEVNLHITTTGLLAGDDDFSWVAGLDGIPRITPGRFDLPASATGQWVQDQENVLALLVDEIGNNNVWDIRLTFDAGTITMSMSGEAGELSVTGAV
jgi:CubicO group peptidase (beta-lactamase class C family)